MFDSGLWAERLKKEKALRKNEKTSNLVQEVQGDAIFGAKSKYSTQKVELIPTEEQYANENAEPNKFRAPNNNNYYMQQQQYDSQHDDKISCKVGQSVTQQAALQSRTNSLVARYRQKREEQNCKTQASFDMLLGKGITERDPISTQRDQINGLFNQRQNSMQELRQGSRQQIARLRQGGSGKEMNSRHIFKAMDFQRAASANRLNPQKLQQVGGLGTVGARGNGLASALNSSNIGKAPTDAQSYMTSAQVYGKSQNEMVQGKGASESIRQTYNQQFSTKFDQASRGGFKNKISSDFVLGNGEQEKNATFKAKPPKAPTMRSSMAMDVQAVNNAQELAAYRNKQSNVFN